MGIKTKLFKAVTKTQAWDWIISHPMARVKFRFYDYPKYNMEYYHQIVQILHCIPGIYAFVGVDTKSLSFKLNRLVTNAEWSHAGIILPPAYSKEPQILHSVVAGLCIWDLLSYLRECDDFCLIKLSINDHNMDEALARIAYLVKNRLGSPYDAQFDLGDQKRFYCSEVVYYVGDGLVDNPDFHPVWISDSPFFTPDDVYKSGTIVSV